MAADPRTRRVEQNESAFRAVDEQSDQLAMLLGIGSPFVCECDRADCTRRLYVPVTEYERVRGGERFIVAAGHERADERIVEQGQNWVAVERVVELDAALPTTIPRDRVR
jgi:hypothetical protein